MGETRTTAIRIKDWPFQDRPREKLLSRGAEYLTDAELIAVILGTGHPRAGLNALDVGRLLLREFGSLEELRAAGIAELRRVPGVGGAKVCQLKAAIELAARIATETGAERPRLLRSHDVFVLLRGRLGSLRHEQFVLLLTDSRRRLIKEVLIARGSLTAATVHPREVLLPAIRESAHGIVLAHNHPSGDPLPSESDLELTRRISVVANALGVELLDHVVITKDRHYSFRDENLIMLQPADCLDTA